MSQKAAEAFVKRLIADRKSRFPNDPMAAPKMTVQDALKRDRQEDAASFRKPQHQAQRPQTPKPPSVR